MHAHRSSVANAPPALDRDALAREVDRLVVSDPRAGLALAERWLAEDRDPVGRARALRATGYALRFNGLHERSAAAFEQAERAFEALHRPDEVARTRVGRVDTLRYLGDYEAASRVARENLTYLRSLGDAYAVDVARQTNNLGLIRWRLGDLRGALACFRRARTILRRHGEAELEATASMNVGLILAELGRYREALRADQFAIRRFRALGARERLATVLMNLGLLHVRGSDFGRALQAFEESRALCEELGLDQKRAEVDLDLARTYLALNLDAEAADACNRAVTTLRALDLPFELGHALMRLGQVDERRGDLPSAHKRIAEARIIFARIGNALWEAIATAQLVRVTSRLGDTPSLTGPWADIRDAARRLEALGALDHAATAYLAVGDVEARLGSLDAALDSYGTAARIGEQLGADGVLHAAYAARGLLREQAKPDEALIELARAVEHLERLRVRARADDLKMSVVAERADLYERIAGLLLRRDADKHARAAFRWIERGKSRGLLEQALAGHAGTTRGATPELVRAREQIQDLRARLDVAYNERFTINGAATATSRAAVAAQDVGALEADLARATRRLQILLRGDDAVDVSAFHRVDRVQAALPDGVVLLEYVVLDQELACFTVGRDSFALRRGLGRRSELEEAARWLWFHIRKGAYGAAYLRSNQRSLAPALDRALARLGELLLEPVWSAIEHAEHVVVVPHGVLHSVPFHALTHEGATLLDRATVSYAPSAGVFLTACRRRQQQPGRILALAPNVAGLTWVTDEVQRIGQLFPDSVVRTGGRATRGVLRRNAAQCDTLHLATHGVFRADNPTYSALKLADGWLSVAELAELGNGHALVTLSACHTGMNGVGPGDELLGLTRAVLGAGSAALVASLWAANDETTAALMGRFYEGLRNGRGRAASLREAALWIREIEPHPYFWAPFILVGAP